jgi:hypothetical protein
MLGFSRFYYDWGFTMARMPKPIRARRGAGVRLSLSIEYNRARDGAGPDFGSLRGRDDYGVWEMPFSNPEELDDALREVVLSLHDEATRARDEHVDNSGEGQSVWLKAIGSKDSPIDEIWWEDRERVLIIDFPNRPKSVKPGDLLVVYAAGKGVIVGILEVTDKYYRADNYERWPWALKTKRLVAKPLSEGASLEVLDDERPIGKSIRQKSHIKLSRGEAAKALDALGVESQ